MRLAAAAALAALAGCDRSPSVANCGEHLGGVWENAGATARWHILDGGARLEAYPLVRELPPMPPGTIAAPARLELQRTGREVAGDVVRRWHQGAHMCIVRAPARIRGCSGDRLTLSIGDTGAPSFPGCDSSPANAVSTQLLRRSWP
jgi:hypothetical protein